MGEAPCADRHRIVGIAASARRFSPKNMMTPLTNLHLSPIFIQADSEDFHRSHSTKP